MGQSLSKKELREQLESIAAEPKCNWSYEEVKGLYSRYVDIASSIVPDSSIHQSEFKRSLGLKSSFMADRIFTMLDTNKDGHLDFRELCMGLSPLCPNASVDEKVEFSFRVYDLNGDGTISREELRTIVEGFLTENGMPHTSQQLDDIVETTFKSTDSNHDHAIDLEEYRRMVMRNPQILASLTLSTWNLPLENDVDL